ncbi:MAG: MbnP family protein [Flavobacteriales bacterium]
MKNILLLSSLLLWATISVSQTKLSLKINHKLGSNAFALNDTVYNNLGNKFNITRLEYYLTVVSITHDGGTVTPIDKVLLVNANNTLLDSLTSLNITTLEKVTLAVGVHSSLNHLDPSLYASSHPLAPKSPSMHWGWTPGYRFVAMEGESFSITPKRVYELHSLGDANYFYTTISTAGVTTAGEKTIELNADYLEALKDLDVSNGPLVHGDYKDNVKHLDNFRDHVFTSIEGNASVGLKQIKKEVLQLSVSPNPAKSGEDVKIELSKELQNAILYITDIKGSEISQQKITSKKVVLSNLKRGNYICTIKSEGAILATKKLIVID